MAHMNVKVFNDECEHLSLIIPYNVALVTPHDLKCKYTEFTSKWIH